PELFSCLDRTADRVRYTIFQPDARGVVTRHYGYELATDDRLDKLPGLHSDLHRQRLARLEQRNRRVGCESPFQQPRRLGKALLVGGRAEYHAYQPEVTASGGRGEIESCLERESGLESVASVQAPDKTIGIVQDADSAIEVRLLESRPLQKIRAVDNRARQRGQVAR